MDDILANVYGMDDSAILKADPDTLSLSDKVRAHVALKALIEAAEARVVALKLDMTVVVEAKGKVEGDKGTKVLMVENEKVTVEHRCSTLPPDEEVKDLLKSKGIPLDEAFEVVKSYKVNPSKLDFLVQTGKVTEEEIEARRVKTLAFRIYPSKALKAVVAGFRALAGKHPEVGEK